MAAVTELSASSKPRWKLRSFWVNAHSAVPFDYHSQQLWQK
jgi:hypothetical protein